MLVLITQLCRTVISDSDEKLRFLTEFYLGAWFIFKFQKLFIVYLYKSVRNRILFFRYLLKFYYKSAVGMVNIFSRFYTVRTVFYVFIYSMWHHVQLLFVNHGRNIWIDLAEVIKKEASFSPVQSMFLKWNFYTAGREGTKVLHKAII